MISLMIFFFYCEQKTREISEYSQHRHRMDIIPVQYSIEFSKQRNDVCVTLKCFDVFTVKYLREDPSHVPVDRL